MDFLSASCREPAFAIAESKAKSIAKCAPDQAQI
jgi:hypothetical protein